MRWILDLDISLLVSGIARKHGIMPKTIFGAPSILPPPKNSIFFQEEEISREREFVASQIWGLQENVFNHANLFGGAIFMFPPFNPPKSHSL
jgi:hypothetical protein